MTTHTITISHDVFARLQKLAEPLVDDTSSVIARLIAHYEATGATAPTAAAPKLPVTPGPTWRSGRGDYLPVGSKLRAPYMGHEFFASVEATGVRYEKAIYPSLSAAAAAAKAKLGKKGAALSTNGRLFWLIQPPGSDEWMTIASFSEAAGQ